MVLEQFNKAKMNWNEKIDLIKKKYSEEEFSVPHVYRKEILRKIETKFLNRSPTYYELNHPNERFSNWWDNIIVTNEETLVPQKSAEVSLLNIIDSNDTFWIAAEFIEGIMIYKAKKDAILNLISIGKSLTNTFHIIQLKYHYLISIRIDDAKIEIKRNLKME